MEPQVGGRPQSRLAVPGANGQRINRDGGGRELGARLRPSMGLPGEASSEPSSVGGRFPQGRSFEGREAWLGCQVPSPFVRLLSCCLGQSPEQPPPERAELRSLPAPAPSPARPLHPARPGSTSRCGRSGQGSLGRGKGGERPRGRSPPSPGR